MQYCELNKFFGQWPVVLAVMCIALLGLNACGEEEIAQEQRSSLSEDQEDPPSIFPRQPMGICDPIPVVKPDPDIDLIKNTNTDKDVKRPVIIVGLPGAVPDEGLITLIINQQQKVQVNSTAMGSFAAVVNAKAQDTVILQYNNSRGVKYSIAAQEHEILPLSSTTSTQPGSIFIPIYSIARVSNEQVRVEGISPLLAEKSILGLNLLTGDVVMTMANDQGIFSLELPALPGDHIKVFIDQQTLIPLWASPAP